jgi:predicted nucleic acid-binding protein
MPAKVFVDTNIWIYSLVQSDDPTGDKRHHKAVALLTTLSRPTLNSQVIRETCSNLIKKSAFMEEALRHLIQGWYRDCEVTSSNVSQHLRASGLRESYALSYWDSLIVASALDAGCSILYSEDMQHGQVFERSLTIVNPFK